VRSFFEIRRGIPEKSERVRHIKVLNGFLNELLRDERPVIPDSRWNALELFVW